ncbi:MAG: hypothetical protein ABEI97_00005, partial [Candidatus Nanohaloarchaea archaeon]
AAISVTFYPFIPDASQRIWEMLGRSDDLVDGSDRLAAITAGESIIQAGEPLGDREILFEKVDADDLAEQVDDEETAEDDTMDDTISFDEFQDLDLRVGTVTSVTEHPNADKLYLLQIDVGDETLQTCSGLVDHYTADELDGKQVVVLANLEPSEIRGEESECMVLAADDGDDVVLVTPEQAMANGAEVR